MAVPWALLGRGHEASCEPLVADDSRRILSPSGQPKYPTAAGVIYPAWLSTAPSPIWRAKSPRKIESLHAHAHPQCCIDAQLALGFRSLARTHVPCMMTFQPPLSTLPAERVPRCRTGMAEARGGVVAAIRPTGLWAAEKLRNLSEVVEQELEWGKAASMVPRADVQPI